MEGYETSAMFLRSFLYTIMTFKACQKRAQEEMDRVVGNNRLPAADDFKNLVYLDALVKEVSPFFLGFINDLDIVSFSTIVIGL